MLSVGLLLSLIAFVFASLQNLDPLTIGLGTLCFGAIIKFGHLIAEARGKLNGTVFSRNRGGAYMRTKVTPTNPASTTQVAARNILTTQAQAWRSLTNAQRVGWAGLASQLTRTNIFGDSSNLSGIGMFVRLNANILKALGSPNSNAPNPQAVEYISAVTLTAAAGTPTFSIAFTKSDVTTTMAIVIEATPQLSAGIGFFKGKYRVISVQDGDETSPLNMIVQYNAKFGTLVAGKRVAVRLSVVDRTTGLESQKLETSSVIAA